MSLRVFSAVLEWVEQLRIQRCQASQILSVYLIGLAFVGVDEPHFARIGYQHLVSALLEHSANPGRVGSCLYGYAQRLLLRVEASPEGLRGGTQPTLLHNLTALGVDEAQMAVFVAEIQSGCNLWPPLATIHSGSILLSFGPLA